MAVVVTHYIYITVILTNSEHISIYNLDFRAYNVVRWREKFALLHDMSITKLLFMNVFIIAIK